MNSIGRMPYSFRFWADAYPAMWSRRGHHDRHDHAEGAERARSRQALDLRAAVATQSEAAKLTITTDEGDVVTLESSTSIEVTYASLRQRQRGPDGSSRVRAEVREIEIDHSLKLSVQGDLNEEELADIRALVERLRPALSGSGQDAAALATTLDPSELDSLSGFEFRLERSESWVRLHVRRRESGQEPVARSILTEAPPEPQALAGPVAPVEEEPLPERLGGR